ncbi:Outer membrane efflux protein [Peptoclostridium litorale DSM 5388]|uniref:Outer membrane efflux protein n=1 Tax=Peptoclostridium litorale DSM 5388 TaxID=1121324 RepID=A0A069RFF4_PEPLI|nr:TolC family protein [Peptoclostridium litorale]KDR95764.1 hypothetical protein CLIT_10c04910 [Peptoclostridium litorale DSM 5388]SIO21788.1 Outer membrane efflux protein [Peptoclostridium litorale DSM 5388]
MKRILSRAAAVLGVAAVFACCGITSFAQEEAGYIESVVEQSIQQNPDVILSGLELEKSDAEIEKLKRELGDLKDESSYSQFEVQTLEAQIHYGELLADISHKNMLDEKTIEIKKAYYDYLYSTEKVKLMQKSLDTAKELLEQAIVKLDAGYISKFEYEQVEMSFRQKEIELEKAAIDMESTGYGLNILVGEDFKGEVEILNGAFEIEGFDLESVSVDEIIEYIGSSDYFLLSLEKTTEISRIDYQKSLSYYTDINLDTKIKKAQYEKNAFNLENAMKTLEKELAEELAVLKLSAREIGMEAEEVEHQQKKYSAKVKEYESGYATILDVENEYMALESKQLDYFSKVYKYNISLMNFKEKYNID